METLSQIVAFFRSYLQYPLFTLGKNEITFSLILYLVISVTLLFYLSSKLKYLLQNKILAKYNVDIGIRQAISAIIRYIIVIVGLVVIFQTTGIDLSFITILAGALGVGIGFGLQTITNNFVSGLVILIERPIKVGDRIEVSNPGGDPISGDVINISSRATTVLTNDNIAIIVPNSNFITSTVINWSYNDRRVRFNFKIGVHHKEDPAVVKRLLMEVAKENDGVLNTPTPDVLFDKFGDSSMDFILRVWTTRYIQKPGVLRSQLYYAIHKKFKENNIEIPYPQRDLHFRTGFGSVKDSDIMGSLSE